MTIMDVKKKRGRRTIRPSEEELAKLYANHTAKEIAEIYNVSVRTAESWVVYYRKQHKKGELIQDGR